MRIWIASGIALAALALAPGEALAQTAPLTGTVVWKGAPRKAATMKVTQDHAVCGKADKAIGSLLVDASGGVRNVVVSLVGVPNAQKPAPSSGTLEQKTCEFVPHVQALPVGSALVVTNDDGVLHNVHGYKKDKETLFNLAMPTKDMTVKQKLAKGLNSFRCDAGHVWMSAYVWTFDHPYYAVTDAAGRFSIANVPPGTYKLRAWHEGWSFSAEPIATTPVTVEKDVVVEAGKPASVTIELK